MKKMLLVLGVAAAAMTSCTSDEVLEMNPTNTIKFESFVNKGTRAVVETNSPGKKDSEGNDIGLTKFYVFGGYGDNYTNVFNNIAVTYNTQDRNWAPATEAEWTKNVYKFAAYATANGSRDINGQNEQLADAVSFSVDGLKFTNYVVSDDEDLVAALVASVDNSNFENQSPVALTFNHMLAQVKFTFKNTDTSHTMSVSDIRVSNVNNKGTGTLTSSGISWTDLSVAGGYALSYAKTTDNVAVNGFYDPDYQMVIPQTLNTSEKEVTITFTITFYDAIGQVVNTETFTDVPLVYDNDETQGSGNKNFTAWLPGYRYNYTANFPADPKSIRFTATVSEWQDITAEGDNDEPGDSDMDF